MSARTPRIRLSGVFAVLAVVIAGSAHAATLQKPEYLGPRPPKQVRRVVTLAPSLSEIVIALGAADRLVGVSRFDDFPEVKSLPRVGGYIDPSIEAVLALKPDLVIVEPSPGNKVPVEKLAQLGTPVLAVPLQNVEQTLESMREVGRALGREAQGEALVKSIQTTRERIRSAASGKSKPRVLLVYEWSPLVVAGVGSFGDELLKDAGAINAAPHGESSYPVLPIEAAVGAAPEVIIDSSHDPSLGEKLRQIRGLAEARWVRISTGDLMHPGPKLARGLEDLFRVLHPGGERK